MDISILDLNSCKKKVSGIYSIECTVNKKHYVGSSNNIIKRLSRHKSDLEKLKHHSIKLQRAYNKYGKENFIFHLVETCKESELLERENYWIKYLNSVNNGYNIVDYDKNGRIIVSDETKVKHSKRMKERLKDKTKNPFYGQNHTGENNGMYGKHHSYETKNLVSKIKSSGRILVFERDGKEFEVSNLSGFCKDNYLDYGGMKKLVSGKWNKYKNIKFIKEYKEFDNFLIELQELSKYSTESIKAVFCHMIEEAGEIGTCLNVEETGRKELKDPITSECLDLVVCALILFFKKGGTVEQAHDIFSKKLYQLEKKWLSKNCGV